MALQCGWGHIKSSAKVIGKGQWVRRFYWLDQKCMLFVYEDEAIDSRCDKVIKVFESTFMDNCHANPGEFIFFVEDSTKPITVRFGEGDKWRKVLCSRITESGLSGHLRSRVRSLPQQIQGGLKLEIIEVKQLNSKKSDNPIDPYCVVLCDDVQVHRSDVASHMLWRSTCYIQFFCYSLRGNIVINIRDNKSNKCIGQCRYLFL